MPTLILSPRYSQDSNDLLRASINMDGWNTHRAIRHLAPPNPDVCCVYGEMPFCDIMAERANLGLLEPPPRWLDHVRNNLGYEWLKRDLFTCEARDLKSVRDKRFIKPANDKVFSYGVFEKGSDAPIKYVDPSCPCIVSEVVSFLIEMRIYLLDGKVAAWSFYSHHSDKSQEENAAEAFAWLNPLLESSSDLDLPSSVVLDIGYIEERGWAFVEANQLYASGIYVDVNPVKLFEPILRASGPMNLVSAADLKYLRNPPELGSQPGKEPVRVYLDGQLLHSSTDLQLIYAPATEWFSGSAQLFGPGCSELMKKLEGTTGSITIDNGLVMLVLCVLIGESPIRVIYNKAFPSPPPGQPLPEAESL